MNPTEDFLRRNWIILLAAVVGGLAVGLLGRAVVDRLAEESGGNAPDDAVGASAPPFGPDRVYLVCGNDEGAPNDLAG